MENSTITVRTSDGHDFKIDSLLAMQSSIIKTALDLPGEAVPLNNVTSSDLKKIVNFFNKQQETEGSLGLKFIEAEEGQQQQCRFMEAFREEFDAKKKLRDEELVSLLCAVSYLEIEVMQDIMCRLMVDRVKNKSLDYCRKLLGVSSDYTDEEEARIRKDYSWVFEGCEIEDN